MASGQHPRQIPEQQGEKHIFIILAGKSLLYSIDCKDENQIKDKSGIGMSRAMAAFSPLTHAPMHTLTIKMDWLPVGTSHVSKLGSSCNE